MKFLLAIIAALALASVWSGRVVADEDVAAKSDGEAKGRHLGLGLGGLLAPNLFGYGGYPNYGFGYGDYGYRPPYYYPNGGFNGIYHPPYPYGGYGGYYGGIYG